MKQYNIDEFIWFVPAPRNKCAITFPRERAFNLNAALLAELGRRVDIAFHPSEPVLCLRKAKDEGGFPVLASGSITSADLTEQLLAAGMKPPVRFTVTRQDEYWIAHPEPYRFSNAINPEKPPKRPRKLNPARVLEGVK